MIPTRVALLVAVLGSSHCGDSPAPPPPRGLPPAAKPVRVPNAAPAPEPAAPKAAWDERPRPGVVGAKPTASAADAPERDYAAELRAALGDPASCLKPRLAGDAALSELTIELEAYLLEPGNVGRSYARSRELDPEELACVQRRLGGVRLSSPIDQAPRAVHTSVKVQLKAPPP